MIVADVEASGLDPSIHSLVSIGAVDLAHPERQFYGECRIWEGAQIMPDSLAINGFTEEEITSEEKQSLHALMRALYAWLTETRDHTLIGQNVTFDRDFMNDAFRRSELDFQFSFRTIDLHSLAYIDHVKRNIPIPEKFGKPALSLDRILEYVGLPPEPKPHHGLTGARVEAEAFMRLVFEQKLLDEFAEYDIPRIPHTQSLFE